MSKATELAKSLIEVHNGHADEGPTVFTEAAALLRQQEAVIKQMLEALLDATASHAKQGAYKRMTAAIAAAKEILK